MLTYIGEFKVYWRTLVAACMGLALGSALNHYMTNLFGPPLIDEFGWARSQFALVGSISLLTIPFVPLAGRFVDRFGARVAALVGFTIVPLTFFAYSLMTGSIFQFFGITIVQHTFGILTTSLVFCRVVVERFDFARGMALSIVMSGAPLMGAIAVPLVGEVVDSEGWRAGYRTLAAISAIGGFTAIALMGRQRRKTAKDEAPEAPPKKLTRAEFGAIVRKPAFLLLIGGMFLCNFPQVIVSSQLKLVLMDSGAASRLATYIVSLYAIGVVVGRFISGLALDRVPAHIVAIFALGLPAVGFMVLASPASAGWLLAGAVLLVGLAQGAEGDVGAYITSRKFDMKHYSFVYSFLIVSMGAAASLGSLLLSATLHTTGTFDLFLVISAIVTIAGAICFYLTGRFAKAAEPDAVPVAA
jgi:MFS family permease